jgi:hypothetical protein
MREGLGRLGQFYADVFGLSWVAAATSVSVLWGRSGPNARITARCLEPRAGTDMTGSEQ